MPEDFATTDRIVLNNFEINDARALAGPIRTELPGLHIASGEEHAATPAEWIAIILQVDTWVHTVGPHLVKELGDGALVATGNFIASTLLKRFIGSKSGVRKEPESIKSTLGQALETSPANRLDLQIELGKGRYVIIRRSIAQSGNASEALLMACALAEALHSGSVSLPERDGLDRFFLEADKRGIRLAFVDKSGTRSTMTLRWKQDQLELGPIRKARRKG